MAFNPFTIIKSLLIKEENTLTPKQIEIVPGGTANTKTTLVGSQTTDKTLTLPNATDTLTANAATQSLTNKTIDADLNTITNIENADIKVGAAIDAAKIHDGSVSNTEFGYLDGVTSSIQTQLNTNATNISNHISDAVAAHAASAISNTPAGTIAATDVQTAVNELDTDIQAHINDTAGAHAASAISNTPSGNLAATDVQGALNEIQTELDAAVIVGNNAATKTLNNLTTTSLNADLLPSGAGARNLGSSSLPFGTTNTETLTRQTVGNLTISTNSGSLILNPSTIIDANNKLVSNLASPVSAGDAVNKEYADSIAAGFDPKTAVRVATTASLGGSYATTPSNGRFTGAATVVDGVTLAANDRVLVKDQVDQRQNGIYVYDGAGQYTRAADSDGSPTSEVSSGNFTFATQGTINSAAGFVLLGNGILILNTDNLAWTQSSGGSGGASRFLDNLLSPVAINQDLLPGATNSRDLGSSSLRFKDAYLQGNLNFNGSLIGTNTSGSSNDVTTSSVNSVLESPTLNLRSGNNSGAGGSGNVILEPGTAGGTRGSTLLRGRRISIESALNLVQGQSAIPLSGQQSLTIPSNSNAEGLVTLTASDSTTRNILTAASTGLPQAPNLIINGDAEGKLAGSTSIFTPYAANEAVTFTDAGDLVTVVGHNLSTGNIVSFSVITSTTGIVINTSYFVIFVSSSTFQLASTLANAQAGTALALTTNGTGTMLRALPLTGTGGVPNVTATVTNTSSLSGTKSYELVKDAANRMGQGWSILSVDVPLAMRARVLSIKFDYVVASGTFVAGTTATDSDVTFYIYDVTNNTLIQPSSFRLLSNSLSIVDQFQAEFQTSSNISSFRLVAHVATPSTSAYTLRIDNIVVSPSQYVFGSPVSDWQAYTPTFQGFGAVTNILTYYRRVGSDIEIRGRYLTGSVDGTEARISLPLGLTSASNIGSPEISGKYGRGSSTTSHGGFMLARPNITYLNYSVANTFSGTASDSLNNAAGNTAAGSAETVSFQARILIAGQSSSVQMADQTSTRIVDFAGYVSANQALTANVTNLPVLAVKDTHAAWNGSAYVVPVPGDYQLNFVAIATTGAASMKVYRNGALYGVLQGINTGAWTGGAVVVENCLIGDTISIRGDSAVTVTGGASTAGSRISIARISGPSQIAASETVGFAANTASNAATTSAPFIYTTKEFDTHNAYNNATGVFTAPIAGLYLFSCASQGNTNVQSTLIINGAINSRGNIIGIAPANPSLLSKTVALNAGDTVSIRPSGNCTADGSTSTNFFSGHKVGNRG